MNMFEGVNVAHRVLQRILEEKRNKVQCKYFEMTGYLLNSLEERIKYSKYTIKYKYFRRREEQKVCVFLEHILLTWNFGGREGYCRNTFNLKCMFYLDGGMKH